MPSLASHAPNLASVLHTASGIENSHGTRIVPEKNRKTGARKTCASHATPSMSSPYGDDHPENSDKLRIVADLLRRHENDPVLIIGTYLEQIDGFADELRLPLLKGSSSQAQRDALYEKFRRGELKRLVVSKIANFSADLPDAAVAIQVSGMFGSRQEEAQRLGRILRPKPGENQAHFYSIVSRDTVEQDFALNRQGYEYRIVTLDRPDAPLPGGG